MEETTAWVPPVPPSGEPPEAPPPREVIPWEDPSRPWPSALVETVRLLISNPRAAFERVPVEGDVVRPVLFGLLFGVVGIVFASAWQLLFGGAMMMGLPSQPGMEEASEMLRKLQVAYILLSPLIILVSLLLSSALIQFSLGLVAKPRHGFKTTLRSQCYAYAPQVLAVIPFCGAFVGAIWFAVLAVIGLSTMHSISIPKAILGFVLPMLIIGCCFVGLMMVFQMSAMTGVSP